MNSSRSSKTHCALQKAPKVEVPKLPSLERPVWHTASPVAHLHLPPAQRRVRGGVSSSHLLARHAAGTWLGDSPGI